VPRSGLCVCPNSALTIRSSRRAPGCALRARLTSNVGPHNNPRRRAWRKYLKSMDYERSSVFSLLRGPLLLTPQGWVVLITAATCWAAAIYLGITGGLGSLTQEPGRTLTLLLTWPFLVFLFYIRLCKPQFQSSWKQSALLAASALAMPGVELLRRL